MTVRGIIRDNHRTQEKPDQPPITTVIARRAQPDAPQGGLSCPFGAIHLLAIRILSGAKHRPSPCGGTERERIATSLRSSQ